MICPYFYYFNSCSKRSKELYPPCNFEYRNIQSDPPLSVTTTKIADTNDKIDEYLLIPVFHGNINSQILENINSNIKNDIIEFKTQMEAAAEENLELLKKQGKKPIPYQISNTYSITYNKNNLLSVSLIYQEYLNGRNSYIRTAYNYNLQNGESMPLESLFMPGTNYIDILNKKTREKLTSGSSGTSVKFKGIAKDQPYYVDDDNLVIFLRFNEISPVPSSIPVIRIPFSELSSILKPQLLKRYIFSDM